MKIIFILFFLNFLISVKGLLINSDHENGVDFVFYSKNPEYQVVLSHPVFTNCNLDIKQEVDDSSKSFDLISSSFKIKNAAQYNTFFVVTRKKDTGQWLDGMMVYVFQNSSTPVTYVRNFMNRVEKKITEFLFSFIEKYSKILGVFFVETIPTESTILTNYGFEVCPKSLMFLGEEFMTTYRKSLLSLNRDNLLRRYGRGNITVLFGTSTAGKTTIIDLFKKKENLVDYSADVFLDNIHAKCIKKFYPEEYKIISRVIERENVSNVIFNGDLFEEDKIPLSFLPLVQKVVESLQRVYQGCHQ